MITVDPVNDAPVASGTIADQSDDDAGVVAGVATSSFFSDIDGDVLGYSASGLPAGLSIDPVTGVISGTIDNSASQGGPASDGVYSVTVTADDGNGGTVDQTFTWTVANPAPVANDDAASTDEDVAVSGNVIGSGGAGDVADSDADGDVLSVTTFVVAGDPATYNAGDTATIAGVGTVLLASDGSYTFTPDADWNGTVPAITYTLSDGEGGSDTADLVITVDPVNDAPVIAGGDQSGSVSESGNLDNGSVVVGSPSDSDGFSSSDVDGDTLTWSLLGTLNGGTIDPADATYGTFSIDSSTGVWTYALNNSLPATEALNEGDTVTLTYVVEVSDGNGGTAMRNVVVSINGTNDSPVAQSDDGAVTESGVLDGGNTPTAGVSEASGNVLTNDSDVDDGEQAALIVNAVSFGGSLGTLGSSVAGMYGSLVLNSNGTYTYTLDNSLAATQALEQGQEVVEVFAYMTEDPNGAEDSSTLTITVTGTNDQPVITSMASDAMGTVTEVGTVVPGVSSANGFLTASDVDADATENWSINGSTNGTYGTIGIDATTGEWTYTLDNSRAATQALNDGDTATETFTARVQDEHGAYSDQTITITVNGSNDIPAGTGNATVILDEDDTATGSLQDYVDDVDDVLELTGFSVDVDGDGTDEDFAPGQTATIEDSSGNTLGTLTVALNGNYTFTPAQHYAGDVPTVTYTLEETGGAGTAVSQTIDFSIDKLADAPTLGADKTLNTLEDEAAPLGLTAPVVIDTGTGTANNDNPERIGEITISISGAGAGGATLLNGAQPLNFVGGEVTIVLTDIDHVNGVPAEDIPNGIYHMTTAQYEALQVVPNPEDGRDFSLEVSATSYEVDGAGTIIAAVDGATSTQTIDVDVQAVTDGASLTIGGAASATVTGNEDSNITVTGLAAALLDTDGNTGTDTDGSETYWYTVSGLPVGSRVILDGVSTTITSVGQSVSSATSTSATPPTLAIRPPQHFSGDISGVTITLNSLDTDSDSIGTPATLTSSVALDLEVSPRAGDATSSNVSTVEDTAVAFLAGVRVTDTGTGTEVIDSVSFTVPNGWTVTDAPSGPEWSNTGSGSNYVITFTAGTSEAAREAILDAFTITPPDHSSADTTIGLSIVTTDTNTVGGVTQTDTRTTNRDVQITVTPEAERTDTDSDADGSNDVTMTAGHAYSTPGQEDSWFDLNVEPGFQLADNWSNEDSDEQFFAALTPSLASSEPTDSVIGTQFRYSTDGGATFTTVTYVGQPILVPVDYLDTLEVKLGPDVAGTLTIAVQAHTIDTDPDTGTTVSDTSGSATLSLIEFDPVAEAVTMALNARAVGLEDTPIDLNIRTVSSDSSETFNLTISNIPTGAIITYDGANLPIVGGSVTITDFDNDAPMTITPPMDSNQDFTLDVSAVSVDGTSTSSPVSRTINVSVAGVADVPVVTLAASPFTTTEEALDTTGNNQVALTNLVSSIAASDSDGSEATTLRITGLDGSFSISGAVTVVAGTGTERVWSVSASDLSNVFVNLPENYSGTVDFGVAAVATESDGDSLTDATVPMSFTVTPSPEAGIVASAALVEDEIQPLSLAIIHQNGDTDETLGEVYIPVGYDDSAYTLYIGATDIGSAGLATTVIGGTTYYVIAPAQIDQLGAQPAADLDGDLPTLDYLYQVVDPSSDGSLPSVAVINNGSLALNAAPVTDVVDASVTAMSLGTASGSIANNVPTGDDANPDFMSVTTGGTFTVNLHVDSADIDGSEHLVRVLITGLPEGVTVTDAAQIGSGTWLLIYDGVDALALGAGGVDVPVEFLVGAGAANGLSSVTMSVQAQDRGDDPASVATVETDSVQWSLELDRSGTGGSSPPTIVEWEYNGNSGQEDTDFSLSDVIDASVTVPNTAVAYLYTVTIRDLPDDAIVTGMTATTIAGELIYTRTFTVDPGQDSQTALDSVMASISVTAPEHANDNNSDFEFSSSLTASAVGGVIVEDSTTANVPITPVSDEPSVVVSVDDVDEGQTELNATITVSNPIDGADGEIVGGIAYVQVGNTGNPGGVVSDSVGTPLTLTAVSGVAGVPDGDYYIVNVGSSGGSVDLTYTAAGGSTLQPGDVTFTAIAQTQETGAANVATASGTDTGAVVIANNGVTVTSNPATGNEAAEVENPQAIELTGLSVSLVDDDGSESVQTILLSGVPDGFQIITGSNPGDAVAASQASNAGGDGTTNTWLLTSNGTLPAYIGIIPPAFWSGTITDLELVVQSGETSLSDKLIETFSYPDITINAVANGLTIDPTLTFATEGDLVSMNLNASMLDPETSLAAGDDSVETTTLEITGLGEYAAFYSGATLVTPSGYDVGSDTYTLSGLTQDDLDNLSFVQAASALTDQDGGAADTQISISAYTTESSNSDQSATVNGSLTVYLDEVLATTGDDIFINSGNPVDGNAGNDTVMLRVGESIDHSALASLLEEVETIDLSVEGANTISGGLSESDAQSIFGSTSGTLTIDGDGDDSVELLDGGEWSTTGAISGGYITYTSDSGFTLQIDADINVSYVI